MAVKIRLARRGRKKLAMYDVVIADARAPRDGRFIEKIGIYNPNTNPATIDINDDRAFKWVMDGAQPTDTVKAMLSYRGVMLKKHLQVGVNKGALTQEQADAKFEEWKNSKDAVITGKMDSLAKQKAKDAKDRLDAETKVKEARAEALQKKKDEAEAAAKAAEAPAEEVVEASEEVAEGEVAEEAPKAEAAEAPVEEAPKAEATEAPAEEAAKTEAPAEGEAEASKE